MCDACKEKEEFNKRMSLIKLSLMEKVKLPKENVGVRTLNFFKLIVQNVKEIKMRYFSCIFHCAVT